MCKSPEVGRNLEHFSHSKTVRGIKLRESGELAGDSILQCLFPILFSPQTSLPGIHGVGPHPKASTSFYLHAHYIFGKYHLQDQIFVFLTRIGPT